MQESKKRLEQNREFALAMIVEALHREQISECDALDLAFEANGNHGDWTEERIEALAAKVSDVANRRFLAKSLQGVAVR